MTEGWQEINDDMRKLRYDEALEIGIPWFKAEEPVDDGSIVENDASDLPEPKNVEGQ